jgi:hypothetical protein
MLAEIQGTTAPLIIGHRVMGVALLCTGDIVNGRAHLDRVIALTMRYCIGRCQYDLARI